MCLFLFVDTLELNVEEIVVMQRVSREGLYLGEGRVQFLLETLLQPTEAHFDHNATFVLTFLSTYN